ncbi:MAG: hypothetical protein PHV37_04675 [Candidatus Gastranaerophilales bacterium]|nr:hypothetical protein [Candidatus Gastranaerophilales bacterium]
MVNSVSAYNLKSPYLKNVSFKSIGSLPVLNGGSVAQYSGKSFNFNGLEILAKNNIALTNISFKGSNYDARQVLSDLNSRLIDVSAEEIDEIIESLPAQDEKLGLKILNKGSQYGNFQSLNEFYDGVEAQKISGRTVYEVPNYSKVGIVSTYNYLNKKGAFVTPITQRACASDVFAQKSGAFIVDKNVVEELKENPGLVRHIKENDFLLLYPYGWDEGFTAFNTGSKEHLEEKVLSSIALAKANIESGMSEDEAIDFSLNHSVKKALDKLGIGDKLLPVQNRKVIEKKALYSDSIAENFASKKMEMSDFESSLPSRAPYSDVALDLLANDAKLISIRELALMAEKMNENLLKLADEKNISHKQIYYMLPLKNKSYCLIANQYQQVNDIPSGQFIYGLNSVPNNHQKKLVVLLDDYAGSGDSMREFCTYFRNEYKGEMVLAPYFANGIASYVLGNYVKTKDDKCTFLPAKKLDSYYRKNEYTESYKDKLWAYNSLKGSNSWGGTEESLVLPYMAPDTNIEFFARKIAKHYTLNSAGVKYEPHTNI